MKVAVCLSGQPRNALHTFPYIYNNIIKPNNADVFMHLNFDNDNRYILKSHKNNGNCIADELLDKKLIDLYKPKKVLVEAQKKFYNSNIKICEKRLSNSMKMNNTRDKNECRNHDLLCVYSMFYGIYKSNELKELFALENNIQYDFVIRLRYDVLPNDVINCSTFDSNFIHYINIGQPDNIISDWFNMGSNVIMNCFSSIFLQLEYINLYTFYKKEQRDQTNTCYDNTDCIYGPEHIIRDYMNLMQIPKKSIISNLRLS
jgi:hypothetical protein